MVLNQIGTHVRDWPHDVRLDMRQGRGIAWRESCDARGYFNELRLLGSLYVTVNVSYAVTWLGEMPAK